MAKMICEICEESVSPLAARVVRPNGKVEHLSCHDGIISQNSRDLLRQEQTEDARLKALVQQEHAKAEKEIQDARTLALRNADLERQRIANLVQAEREKLKNSGAPAERFSLIEVAEPEEIQAIESAKKSQEDALTARQKADLEKICKCVRCGAPTDSQEHPNHCSQCWNTDPAKPVQQDLEQDVKDALKRGVRPLELE